MIAKGYEFEVLEFLPEEEIVAIVSEVASNPPPDAVI